MDIPMRRAVPQSADRYEIPIFARSISRVYVASGFDIEFVAGDSETAIRVADPLAVVTESPRPLIRTQPAESVASSLVLGKIIVRGAAVREERMIEVSFSAGVRFWVEPQGEISDFGPLGTNAVMVLCMPGSQMAVWFGKKKKTAAVASEVRAGAASAVL